MTAPKKATKPAPAKPANSEKKQPLKEFNCIGTEFGRTVRETILASDHAHATKGFQEKHPKLTAHAVSEK